MAGVPGRSLQSPRGDVAVHMVGNRRLLTQVNAVRVHVDGNPDSGLYYYLPRRFDLAWSPETQYALTVIYGMAGATDAEGQVLMAARLETSRACW